MKRMLILLAAAVLLAGCSAGFGGTTATTSSFPVEQTPTQMLSAAVERITNASSFTLNHTQVADGGQTLDRLTVKLSKDGRGGYVALAQLACGCSRYISGSTATHSQCQTGQITSTSAETPFGLEYILQDLPQVEAGLLERFAQLGLTASPSNTGTTRFEVNSLTYAQQCWLLTGLVPPGCDGEEDGFGGFFAMTIDSTGALVAVEYSGTNLSEPVTHRISITKVNQKTQIDTPWWAQ